MANVLTQDISLVEASFGEAPFDFGHARETGQLAKTIGESLGLTGDDLLACLAAGYFHDLGRNIEPEIDVRSGMLSHRVLPSGQKARHGNRGSVDGGRPPSDRPGKVSSWMERAPHAVDSADLAGDALLVDINFVSTGMIERVKRVIGQHSIHGPAPVDPIARALYDADLLECFRFRPFYGDDVNRFEKFVAHRLSKVATQFAKNPEIQATWRRNRINAYSAKKPEGGALNSGAVLRDKSGHALTAEQVAMREMAKRR